MAVESASVEERDVERKHIAVSLRKLGTTILKSMTCILVDFEYEYAVA